MPKTLPQFKNIAQLKTTPRSPVILYCTRQQWGRLSRKMKRGGRLQRNRPAVRFEPAPWGGGDVIFFPVIPAFHELGSPMACIWKFRKDNGGYRVELICLPFPGTPKVPAEECHMVVLPSGIELGCRPAQTGCHGICQDVFVPDPNGIGGFFQCQCRRF